MAKLTGFLYMLLLLTVKPLVAQGFLYEIAGAVGGAALVYVAAPIALTAAGFTAGGIAAGSFAAKFMSFVYSTNTGIVILSSLQSTGAAGFAATTTILGGTIGWVTGHFFGSHYGRHEDEKDKKKE